MNVLVIADDDSVIRQLPENRVDLLLSLGDLSDLSIHQAAARCQCKRIFAVKGNHDSAASFGAPITDLHLKRFEFGGLQFGGFGGSWKYKPRGHHLYEQTEVEELLAGFPQVDVFVAHNSPLGVHDKDDDVHTGFVAFMTYVEKQHPRLLLHGHQHVSRETWIGSTKVAGIFGFKYLVID